MQFISSSEFILKESREYSLYVCSTRAIPSVIDGLKHIQRIALWVLKDRNDKLKTYSLSGLLGYLKLNVHGESAANDAISLLAAPYKNNVCLIEGLGQFGSRIAPDDDGIGAPRYTEVRRSKAAEAFLYNDINLVPLEDNYDGSNKAPKHFLPLIPTILLNGVSGIAVGWSTEILPRSLKSLIEATKLSLQGKPIPTIKPYYNMYNITVEATDKPNQWEYTGKVEIIDTSTVKVTEIPPGTSIENFRSRLIDMEENDQILNFIDRSTEKIDITIKMKRGSVKDWTEQIAIDFFKIKEKTTERIVAIDWNGNSIRQYETAEELIVDFANWRLQWYTKRFQKLLDDTNNEILFWYTLSALFKHDFPNKLGKFDSKQKIEFEINEIAEKEKIGTELSHIERIVNLPTYRWTIEFKGEVDKRIKVLEDDISDYISILASPEKLKKIYMSELSNLEKIA